MVYLDRQGLQYPPIPLGPLLGNFTVETIYRLAQKFKNLLRTYPSSWSNRFSKIALSILYTEKELSLDFNDF
jgi:hypothetical protein